MEQQLTQTIRHRVTRVGLALAVLTILLASGGTVAAEPDINKTFWGDVAIDGYDPVAYFTKSKATRGSDKFTYKWSGANWHFSSAAHRALFIADPEKYAPQFGGHCAVAASIGEKANVDPRAWTIWRGQLYLNYDIETNERFANRAAEYVKEANEKAKSATEK